MSRSGYSDDYDDNWGLICWRGAVAKAITGSRGQSMLRELLTALDAMPMKRLIKHKLLAENGEVCTLGALGVRRRIANLHELDPYEPEEIAKAFGVARALIQEIEYENDEGNWSRPEETAEARWARMRKWVHDQIKQEASDEC